MKLSISLGQDAKLGFVRIGGRALGSRDPGQGRWGVCRFMASGYAGVYPSRIQGPSWNLDHVSHVCNILFARCMDGIILEIDSSTAQKKVWRVFIMKLKPFPLATCCYHHPLWYKIILPTSPPHAHWHCPCSLGTFFWHPVLMKFCIDEILPIIAL